MITVIPEEVDEAIKADSEGYLCDYPGNKPANYHVELVEHYGGEGQGDTYYSVYKFTHKDDGELFYVKVDGWYQSYYGSEYSSHFLVAPVETVVTVYDPI